MGFLGGFDDPVHGGAWLAEADVVGDSVLKQVDVLEHEAEILHEGVKAVVLDVYAAKGNLALLHVPEAGHEVAEGRLAAA